MKRLRTGQKVKITCKATGCCVGQTAPYPYWNEQFIPVEIIGENRNFYTVRVLPHMKKIGTWGMAIPYVVSIDKFDLDAGNMIIKEY